MEILLVAILLLVSLGVSANYLLLIAAWVLILFFLIKSYRDKDGSLFIKTPFTAPALAFGAIVLVSSFANNLYPVESLLGWGGVFLSYVAIVVLGSSLLMTQKRPHEKQNQSTLLLLTMLAGMSLLFLMSTMLQYSGYDFDLRQINNIFTNPLNSLLAVTQISLITAVGLVFYFIGKKKIELWQGAVLGSICLAICFYVWLILPGKNTAPLVLNPLVSWSVVLNSFKDPMHLLFGSGPSGYTNSFNLFRPQWYNLTPLWNVQFAEGSNFPLTIAATLGIFGLLVWLMLLFVTISETKKVSQETVPVHAMLVTTFVLQLISPANIILLATQAILMAVWASLEKKRLTNNSLWKFTTIIRKFRFFQAKKSIISKVISLLLISLGCIGFFLTLQATYAHYLMTKADGLIKSNQITAAYDIQKQAVRLNPFYDSYRRKYALNNLVIATTLAQKTDLTEGDKEQFAALTSQAIREAKASIQLDHKDVNNHYTLAQIYQNLLGTVTGASDWSIAAYVQAIKLAPTNPELRIKLGSIYFRLGENEQALNFFEQAISLKPNLPNAYFNAGNILKKMERYEEAREAFNKASLLVRTDSEDYIKVANELEQINAIIIEKNRR